jgi:urea transport system permease protein
LRCAAGRSKHERPARPARRHLRCGAHSCSRRRAVAVAGDIDRFCLLSATVPGAALGKYLCYAILAVALDLVWGYCGILSLGHGGFFALGGYAMGMYLMRQIGARGVYANLILPDFMVFLNWKELPVAWSGFNWFPYAMAMVVLVPGLLALAFGWFAFRSRGTGVYLSIITQAMTFALFKEFFRNDFGFGGNNGLTHFKDLLGFSLQSASTKAVLFSASAIALIIAYAVSRAIIS